MPFNRTDLRGAAITAANWFRLVAASAAIIGAAYLFQALGNLKDSTRFASDLAEIRTFAMRVSLVAETVTQGNSPAYLEHELELAHERSEALTGGVIRLLGPDVGDVQMRAVVVSWDAVADASRRYSTGNLSASDLLTSAERATADVDTLIELIAQRNERIAERLKSLLKVGIALAAMGAVTSAAGLTWAVRQLKESQRRELRSQARFRTLVQHSSDAIAVSDTSTGIVTYASPSVQQIFGTGVLPEGSIVATVVHDEDLPHLQHALDSPRAATDGTVSFRLHHADGGWRYVEASVSDLRSDPLVNGVVLNMRDVTERTRLEAELQH